MLNSTKIRMPLLACLIGLTSTAAFAAVTDVVSQKDTIEFGAPTDRIIFKIDGFKAMPAGQLATNTQLGEWSVKTAGDDELRLAVSFGTNHMPVTGAGPDIVSANLVSDTGNTLDVSLKDSGDTTTETATEQGAKWIVSAAETKEMKGVIRSYKDQTVKADSYPFVMNAAVYNI